jgi:NAD-dependent SIR2 family protein deacetylase
MTRNTKLYKVKINGKDVYYRTLTIKELSIINNITKEFYKNEIAAKFALIDDVQLDFPMLQQIGKDTIEKSNIVLYDEELYKITVENFRRSINDDQFMVIVMKILQVMPNLSIEYLFNQTTQDIIEIGCICEQLSNKRFFNFSYTTKTDDIGGHKYFQESGKTLKEKIKEGEDNLQ